MNEKKNIIETTEKDINKKDQSPSQCDTKTCVCNMEWRGVRDDQEESDCICTNEDS